MADSKPQLIGIAGSFASGKDTLSKRLASDYGYFIESGGDRIRKLSMERHGSIERPDLHETADYYRQTFGADVFIKMQIAEYKEQGEGHGLVINGLRALGEAKAIKAAGGTLVFVDAPIEVRYERMKARHRDAEVELTLEQFEANEQKEWHAGDDDADFNLRDIKAMADVVMDNVLPLNDFILLAEKQLHLSL